MDSYDTRKIWAQCEDDAILDLVQQCGTSNWSLIAEGLKTACNVSDRTGKQCRERWHNHLDPIINKAPWTKHEDEILMRMHSEVGNKWSEISKHLTGRTDNSIKNHWYSTMRRHVRALNREIHNGNPKAGLRGNKDYRKKASSLSVLKGYVRETAMAAKEFAESAEDVQKIEKIMSDETIHPGKLAAFVKGCTQEFKSRLRDYLVSKYPLTDGVQTWSNKKLARKRHRKHRKSTTPPEPEPRKIVSKLINNKSRRKKNTNTVQLKLNLDPKSFQNSFAGPWTRNGIIRSKSRIPNDIPHTPRSTTMLPQLKTTPRSHSSPRLSVQLTVDTNAGSKTDYFGLCSLETIDIAQQNCQLESPLALKQHMHADYDTDYATSFMENLDITAAPFSAPKTESLVFDFNEILRDLE